VAANRAELGKVFGWAAIRNPIFVVGGGLRQFADALKLVKCIGEM